MNPFVNPGKRSILLPSGCKDLIDVLQPSRQNLKGESVTVGQLEYAIKPERFQTAGVSHVRSYVEKVFESRTKLASLRIASLDDDIRVLLYRFASQITMFPMLGLSDWEQAVQDFFAERAIDPAEDYLIGEPGMSTRILGFPLLLDTSGVAKLTIDLMRTIYGLDDEAGLDFIYLEATAA